jgi:hypothetical protein
MNKNITIFGGNGFIGSEFTKLQTVFILNEKKYW